MGRQFHQSSLACFRLWLSKITPEIKIQVPPVNFFAKLPAAKNAAPILPLPYLRKTSDTAALATEIYSCRNGGNCRRV